MEARSRSSCVFMERIALPARLTAPPILECLPRTPENKDASSSMASAAAATWSRPRANKSRVLRNDAAAARASSFCVFWGVLADAPWKSASRSSCSRIWVAWPATPHPLKARASASLSADNRTRARRGATPSCLRRGSGASAAARSAVSNWAARVRRAAAAAPAAVRALLAKDASLTFSVASCSSVSTCFASAPSSRSKRASIFVLFCCF